MQPDFNTLTPVQDQPDVGALTPASSTQSIPGTGGVPLGATGGSPSENIWANLAQVPGQVGSALQAGISQLPGKQLGNAIGTSISGGVQAIKTGSMAPIQQANQTNNANFSKVVGDTAQAVALPASLALGGGSGATALGRVGNAALKYGAVGALGSGGNAAAGGANLHDTLTAGAVGGVTGAALGAGGQAFHEYVAPALKTLTTPKTDVQKAIDAVNPDLTGKKLAGAYKGVVTGAREASSGTMATGQSAGVDKNIQQLGTNLSDVIKSSDPLTNLKSLGTALSDTETQLTQALVQDTSSANPPQLLDLLDQTKASIPREFASIRDSKSTFEDVVDFAKETVSSVTGKDPSISGIRDARIAFDAQAKTEYPSAFKEGGFIDMKTPAGRAIKTVRDAINNYMYQTAADGSQLQQLIGREADIFKAADFIAPKAAKLNGLTTVGKLAKSFKSPLAISVAGAAAALGGEGILKKVGL